MCGIAGILALSDVRPDARPDVALVDRMLATMQHRGPDDIGSEDLGQAAIGMTRLSILDPTPAGHQPMTSADGRYTIVFNGEIYNFLELADELAAAGCRFSSKTDTEVLLAAYATWGTGCVRRFNGIWAFAIWDRLERRLFLSRDHFGVKPLYLAEGDGFLAFASEIKALRTLPWVSSDPDPGVVGRYLADGTATHGRQTFYRSVRCFPPGSTMLVSTDGRPRFHRFWSPPDPSRDASFEQRLGDDTLVEEFRSLLFDAVGLQLRSDVTIGSCLSGGMDSSSIVCIAAALRAGGGPSGGPSGHSPGKRAHTERDAFPQLAFFASFAEAGIDERPYVQAVLERTGIALHTTTPDTKEFLESLPGILHAQDEPFWSTSIVAQYHVMKIAHEAGVKVLLDGQGADELLGGYVRYAASRFGGALRGGSPATKWRALRGLVGHEAPLPASLVYAAIGARPLPLALNRRRMPAAWIGPEARRTAQRDDEPRQGRRGTVLASTLWRDVVSDNLPELLRYEDRNSMAFSIEARVPFLDYRLAEAAMRLPDRLRVQSVARRKIALRRAVQGIVPDAILARRDKVAFQSPERRWLAEAEPTWRALAQASRAEQSGLLAPGAMTNAIDHFVAAGPTAGTGLVWRVLNLEMWLRESAGESPLG